MALDSMQEIFEKMQEGQKPFWKVVQDTDVEERQVSPEASFEKMRMTWKAMLETVDTYRGDLRSLSGLVGGDGQRMAEFAASGKALAGDYLSQVITLALCTAESNACMRKIVAAPTAGACGVLPAVLIPLYRQEVPEEEIVQGLYVAAGIAQALLGNPPFLIFDEPTVGLDPEERIHFRNLFSRTAEEHLVLLSTHIIEDVQSVCDQIVVIHHGTILFTGTPEQLIQSAAGHVGVFWEKDETLEQGLHITARVNTSQGIRCRAVADKLPPYAQAEEPSLEDAYLYLISREADQ